jgi:hypothetical protein
MGIAMTPFVGSFDVAQDDSGKKALRMTIRYPPTHPNV